MTQEQLREAASEAKAQGDYRRAAAILAVLADVRGEVADNARTSPTWRECYACNARAK